MGSANSQTKNQQDVHHPIHDQLIQADNANLGLLLQKASTMHFGNSEMTFVQYIIFNKN
jgi:hypothetical protein